MKWIIISASIAIIFLVIAFVLPGVSHNERGEESISLDPIEIIPEWLQMTVQEALPTDSTAVWIPTGSLETSSLVKVPRFSRKYSSEEISKHERYKHLIINPVGKKGEIQRVYAVKNESVSMQLVITSKELIEGLEAKGTDLISVSGDTISSAEIEVRYVGYVPVNRAFSEYDWSARYEEVVESGFSVSGTMNPDLIADPLYSLDKVKVPAFRNQPVWITIKIPSEASHGTYSGGVLVSVDGSTLEIPFQVEVIDQTLPNPEQFSFYLDMWLNPNAISDFYDVKPWSDKHWGFLSQYFQEQASAGMKAVTTTIIHEPWRGKWINGELHSQSYKGYEGMVKWTLKENGTWSYDYSIFDEYVKCAMKAGITERINVYSMTDFSGQERIVYYDERGSETKTMVFDGTGDNNYQLIWKSFLQDFYTHLQQNGWYARTFLAFDERPAETMEEIINFLKKDVPQFSENISIAGHPESHHYARGDLSISFEFFPSQNLYKEETLHIINSRNILDETTTFYLCGQPDHPNSLTYSPAIESRMIPWIALKYNLDGYLRWSYNNWPKQIYNSPVYKYIQGDEYIIYPGPEFPVSSIRWELLKDGIEDYEVFLMNQEALSSEEKAEIIELATRNIDGRQKEIYDLLESRKILYKCTIE